MDVNQPIDRLNIEVTTNAAEASKGLRSIANALGKIASIVPKLKKINVSPAVDKIKELSKSLQNINIEIDKIDNLKSVGNILSKFANAIPKIAEMDMSSSTGHINQLTVSLKHLADQFERIAASDIVGILRSLSKINFSKLEKAMRGNLQYPAMYTSSYSGYSQGRFRDPGDGIPPNWTRFKKDWDWFYNAFSDWNSRMISDGRGEPLTADWYNESDIPTVVEKTFGKRMLDRVSNIFKQVTSTMGNSFDKMMHSVLRITFYRAIRFLIKAITQATKEGIQAMYAYSDENGLKFADTMDNLNSTMNQMKASLGSAASEIIMLLEPLVVYFADKVMETSNKIAETTASMTNKDYWMKAVRVQSKYVDATQTATDKLKNVFLGIDEINQLGQKQQKLFDYEKVYFTDEQKDPNKIAANVLSILSFVSPAAWVGNVWVRGAQGIDYLIGKIQENIDSNNESAKVAVNQLNSQTEKQQQSTFDVWSSKFEDAIGRQGDEISTAIYNALSSWSIQFDNENVGKVVTSSQNNMARRTSFGASVIMK